MAVSRREFIRVAGIGACAASFGMLGGCATVPVYRGTIERGQVSIREVDFNEITGNKRALMVSAPDLDEPVLLMQTEDGHYVALSGVCTHQSCEVRPQSGFVQCPCHGSVFAMDGAVVRGPAKKPLPRYDVEHTANVIIITLQSLQGQG